MVVDHLKLLSGYLLRGTKKEIEGEKIEYISQNSRSLGLPY
jgi:hypothetical protein